MATNKKPLTLAEVMTRLDDGGTVEEVQSQIRAVSNAVIETGKPGKVTITLNFKRDGQANSRRLLINDEVKASLPKVAKSNTLLYADYEGGLVTSNPDQAALEELNS